MNKIEKLALKKLENKKNVFENKKNSTLIKLLENKAYKDIYKQKQAQVLEYSKNPTEKNKTLLEKLVIQLDKISTSLKIDASILKNDYMCKHCKDKGFINDTPCNCLNQIISEMLMEESGLSLQTLEIEKNNFKIFENPEKIKKIYDLTEKWCNNFENSPIKNWGLFGHAGSGKTHLMLYMLKLLINKGHFVHFTTAFNLTQQLLAQHTNFEEKNRDYLSKYLECEVLFIDDMGTEPKYKNVNENYLYLILNQRMIENKPVIFSSNFDIAQFEDFYGERIFSRLVNKRTSKSLWFDGEDLRLKKTN